MDWIRDVAQGLSGAGILWLGWKTIQQNRRAADRTAAVQLKASEDAVKVDRERLGLDTLESAIERIAAELSEERRLRQRAVRRVDQLEAVMRAGGMTLPDVLPDPV